jgi:hypothetical protein
VAAYFLSSVLTSTLGVLDCDASLGSLYENSS